MKDSYQLVKQDIQKLFQEVVEMGLTLEHPLKEWAHCKNGILNLQFQEGASQVRLRNISKDSLAEGRVKHDIRLTFKGASPGERYIEFSFSGYQGPGPWPNERLNMIWYEPMAGYEKLHDHLMTFYPDALERGLVVDIFGRKIEAGSK